MSVVDTNILVRYLIADDDEAQTRIASDFIDRRCSIGEPGIVTAIVLAELVWVLRTRYRFPKRDALAALDALAQNPHLRFDNETEILAAIEAYHDYPVDMADCLIASRALALGADAVTFDRDASRMPAFKLLDAGA